MFGRVVFISLSSLLVSLGLITFVWPSILTLYGVDIADPTVRITLRAIIGGGEIGIGAGLLIAHRSGVGVHHLNKILAVVFISVGAARLTAGWLEDIAMLNGSVLRESLIELALGVLAWVAAWSDRAD